MPVSSCTVLISLIMAIDCCPTRDLTTALLVVADTTTTVRTRVDAASAVPLLASARESLDVRSVWDGKGIPFGRGVNFNCNWDLEDRLPKKGESRKSDATLKIPPPPTIGADALRGSGQ